MSNLIIIIVCLFVFPPTSYATVCLDVSGKVVSFSKHDIKMQLEGPKKNIVYLRKKFLQEDLIEFMQGKLGISISECVNIRSLKGSKSNAD